VKRKSKTEEAAELVMMKPYRVTAQEESGSTRSQVKRRRIRKRTRGAHLSEL